MANQEVLLVKLLKENYLSNFQMQQLVKSSSADRCARRIRNNPPQGFKMVQRVKDCPVHCLEYKLEPVEGQLKLGVY